ncbi:MAG: hypothetical protein U0516_03040 [Candidatus Saccharibacteria bacterium]
MADDDLGLNDDDLSKAFDEVLNESRPDASDEHTDDADSQGDEAAADDDSEASAVSDSISLVLTAIASADPTDLRKFDRQISPALDAIAASDAETQMLVITLSNQQDLPIIAVVRVLSGLVYRRCELKRDGKRVDYANLNAQVRSFLQGKLAWNDITPREYVEPKPDVDADLVAAGELAAFLKCTVVDVLALADAAKGSNAKTMVSRKKVAEALQSVSKPDDKKPFDYEEPGNGLGEGDAKPTAKADPTDDSLQTDDSSPVTGLEYITVDPADPLSDLDDDWFVKGCRSLVELLDS